MVVIKVTIPSNHYRDAEALLAEGKYQETIDVFTTLDDYKDSAERIPQVHYAAAEALLAEGNYQEAAIQFGAAGRYQDAQDKSFEIWGKDSEKTSVSADSFHTVGFRSDGTVVATGNNSDGQCDVSDWTDIKIPSKPAYTE